MDTLSGITVFSAVAETGGFTAAARALGLSKSAVSKRVADLEDRLGVRLFNRTTRRVALTEIGHAYHARCRRILDDAREAELAVGALHAEPIGTLRVNAPMSFGVGHIAPALGAYLDRYPGLGVEIDFNDRLVDVIDEGYDIAIRIADLPDSSLVARRLAPCRRVVIASPDYLRRRGRPVVPGDLSDHECLIYDYLPNPREWPFEGADGIFSMKIGGRLRANNGELLLQAAIAGHGAYLCPTFICGAALAEGRVEALLEDFEAPEISIYAVWPHNRHLSAKVRSFVDFLVERFGPSPYWD